MHFLHMYEYSTLKPVEVILRRGRRNTGGDELNWDTLYAYMEMLQCKSLYNYHKLIIFFFFFFAALGLNSGLHIC
jgi:hypothetical protein